MRRLRYAGWLPDWISLTMGEQRLLLAFFSVGFFGAAVGLSAVTQIGGGQSLLRPLGLYDGWIIFCGAAGACGGLWMARRRMGAPGLDGFMRALVAIPLVTFFGSLIGGTLAFPGYGTMFAPLSVGLMFYQNPLFTLMWCASIMSAHVFYGIWIEERDSIFPRLVDDGAPPARSMGRGIARDTAA